MRCTRRSLDKVLTSLPSSIPFRAGDIDQAQRELRSFLFTHDDKKKKKKKKTKTTPPDRKSMLAFMLLADMFTVPLGGDTTTSFDHSGTTTVSSWALPHHGHPTVALDDDTP